MSFRVEPLTGGPYEGKGPAFNLVIGSKVIASGGFYILWPGVAEAWLLVSPDVLLHPVRFVKEVRGLFLDIDKTGKMTRIQATVKVHDKRAVKFLTFLGFKIEGCMAKFGPDGTDHYMMGRV